MSHTVNALNAAFAADPAAIRALMINRVPCNATLANDEHCMVERDKAMHGTHFTVGALGLVNAVLLANGLPVVAGKWEETADGAHNKFVGFCEYTPEVQSPPSSSAGDAPLTAAEVMELMLPVEGEVRVVYSCLTCGQLIGRRFIPYGLGEGFTLNACQCYLTQRDCKTIIVLRHDP